ncbi:hypothetical protein DFH07DRAFT_743240 [Mycena maculata]|uniref:Uncharacterized protein n=1 Tax=Mycena maculata TaxID=230809 RepID=A0AAD7J2E1_9AGAR|nr:hypothetical protein DFH07DRAFT_743240 [Mycena maculata]
MFPLRSLLRPSLNRLTSLRPAVRPPQSRPSLLRTYYYPARPASWGAQIWFRADGTPRSKLRGLVLTSLLAGALYATWSTLLVVEALDYERYLLTALVHIQRVDYDYTTAPLDGFAGALAYFADLAGYFCLGDVRPETLAAFFADLAQLAPGEGGEGLGARVHDLVRSAAEAVHGILAASKGADAAETAVLVIGIVDDAMLTLIELVEDMDADETGRLLHLKRLREEMKDSSKGYEILG